MNFDIRRVVLTGGPCAGKTTALARMYDWAIDHGYVPLIVPEAATLLINAGLDPRHPAFQSAVLSHVLRMEADIMAYAEVLAAEGKKPLLICDRGLMDQRAYMDEESFTELCEEHGIKTFQARDERYEGVIFLRSAANGAEEFYSSASNQARYEDLAEAKALDNRTLHAWVGVGHLSIVDNVPGQTFETKITRAVAALAHLLGEPEPFEIERKFKVHDFSPEQLPDHAVASDIVQTYLVGAPGETERVRARGQDNQWVFTNTIKQSVEPGVAIERERIISRAHYEDLLIRRDTGLRTVHKTRYCFVYKERYCELDVFHGVLSGLVILEVEVPSLDTSIELPTAVQFEIEVTADKSFSNRALAEVA